MLIIKKDYSDIYYIETYEILCDSYTSNNGKNIVELSEFTCYVCKNTSCINKKFSIENLIEKCDFCSRGLSKGFIILKRAIGFKASICCFCYNKLKKLDLRCPKFQMKNTRSLKS